MFVFYRGSTPLLRIGQKMPEIIKHLRAVFNNQKLLIHKFSFLFIYFCQHTAVRLRFVLFPAKWLSWGTPFMVSTSKNERLVSQIIYV